MNLLTWKDKLSVVEKRGLFTKLDDVSGEEHELKDGQQKSISYCPWFIVWANDINSCDVPTPKLSRLLWGGEIIPNWNPRELKMGLVSLFPTTQLLLYGLDWL